MKKNERVPGEFVTSVTAKEIIISCGIQLMEWAHQIAFTDAAFGANWSVETADRMASLSMLLNSMFKRLPKNALSIVVDLPDGMIGQIAVNPSFDPKSEEASSDDEASSTDRSGGDSSIDEFPF